MADYTAKVQVVSAFRWTGGIDQAEDPEWMKGRYHVESAGTPDCYLLVETGAPGEPALVCCSGDYIICNDLGILSVMDEGTFKRTFASAKPSYSKDEEVQFQFRVWDKHENTYLSMESYQALGAVRVENDGVLTLGADFRFLTSMMIMVNTFKPELCSGIPDKAGQPIFQGDIVSIDDTFTDVVCDDGTGPAIGGVHLAEVKFQEGCFVVDIKKSGDVYLSGATLLKDIAKCDLKVLGSALKMPEVLKDGL